MQAVHLSFSVVSFFFYLFVVVFCGGGGGGGGGCASPIVNFLFYSGKVRYFSADIRI